MDLFTKILNDNSYLFEKGYPDLLNENDLLIIEQALQKIDPEYVMNKKMVMKEGTIKQNTTKFIDSFIEKAKEKGYTFKKQTEWKRLGNLDKLPTSDFLNLLKTEFNIEDVTVIPPKQAPNPSSKFNLFTFKTSDGEVNLILSGGSNEGEKYEQSFVQRIKESAGKPIEDIDYVDIKTLFNKLNINPEELTAEDVTFEGAVDTKRTPNLETIDNIGKTISDITINYNNQPYYISLKNKAGSGLYSGQTIPFIEFNGENIIYNPDKLNNNKTVKKIFDIFNIDPEKIALGLNDYIEKTENLKEINNSIDINDGVYKLFGSIIGKGYYYVKQKGTNDITVTPILTDEDTKNFIGEITNGSIIYPNKNTKSTTIKLPSKSKIFGDIRYEIQLRNSKGNILPLTVMIRKL